MQTIVKNHSFFILSVLFVIAMLVTGWSLAYHFDDKIKSAGSHKEIKNGSQAATVTPSALDQINIIFVLLCTGLIGFFGVRRQRRTLNDYVKVKQPECKFDENFLNGKNLKRQNCHEMADSPEKCELGMPCLI